ncbi:MAG: hypothetical protein GX791_04450, partial [Synergistaceae bacterium]|nr:hypothetical protein [Synergistaceae bacterium]
MNKKLAALLFFVFLAVFSAAPLLAADTTLTVGQGAEPVELDPQNITDNP